MLDTATIRPQFPILETSVHGKPLIYLDNAARLMPMVQPEVNRTSAVSGALMNRATVSRDSSCASVASWLR